MMNNIFANTNFADEAESYIYWGITERDDVEDKVRKELSTYNPTEEDIQEYVNKLMDAIRYMMEV